MLTTLIAFAILAQGPAQEAPAQKETAAQLISRVLARYDSAQKIAGTVTLTQQAKGVSIRAETQLQFDRATSKVFLKQIYRGSETRQMVLVSDGKMFAYDRPVGVSGPPRFKELVTQHNYTQTVQDLYAAERVNLVDKSPLIDIAFARKQDLRDLMAQWVSMKIYGNVKVGEIDTVAVVGGYRENPDLPPSGNFEAYFTPGGDFVRYLVRQRFAVPGRPNEVIETLSQWDSSLSVNPVMNPALFSAVN